MNFPRHWAKASADKLECWRWSDVSADDARAHAETAVRAIAERARTLDQFPDRYGYADAERPLREEVLREFHNGAGDLTAVITRNAPGCQVLNTAQALFVDIDFPDPGARGSGLLWAHYEARGLLDSLKALFAPAAPKKSDAESHQAAALTKARSWAKANNGWCWRAYRTRAGLRLLATHELFEPKSQLVEDVFETLGADPLYRRLCKTQESFRARLTPKPWRCGHHHLQVRWPWADARRQKVFLKWEERYRQTSAKFATCRLVAEIGEKRIHPELQPLVEVHDQMTRVGQALELA